MRLGIKIDMRNPPQWRRPWARHYGQWLERIQEAERLGADAVWMTEHHFFEDGYLPQCWTLAAAIAATTSTLRIGTAVTLLPLHASIELAEQIALVDILSDGRVEAGFGVGYRLPEYEAFKGDYERRYAVFAQRIRELRQLWGEEPTSDRVVTPAPIQQPVPLWGGFNGPMGARMSGRLGLGLLSLNPNVLESYREGLALGGHDPATARLCGGIECFVTDDPERAWSQLEEPFMYRWQSYNKYMFEGRPADSVKPFDIEAIRRNFLIGTAEEVAAAIRKRIEGLPVSDVYLRADFPGIPDDLVDEHLRRSFTELAPLLRG